MRRLAATLALSALVGAACGGAGVTAPAAQDIPSAILASLAASQRIDVSLDAALDLAEIQQLVAAFEELEGAEDFEDDEEIDKALTALNTFSLEATKAEDLSSGFAIKLHDVPMFELRQDSGEMAGIRDMREMLDAPPAEVTMVVRVDEAAVRDAAELFGESLGTASFSDLVTAALASGAVTIPENLADVVRALAAGQWAGVSGLLDMGSFFDTMGLDEATLDMMLPSTAEVPSRDEVARLLTDSVTFTSVDGAAGEASYLGDLDTDTFVRGAGALIARTDATGMIDGSMQEALDGVTLPPIDGAVHVTFKGDNLTSMTIDLVSIIAEAALASNELPAARADEFRAQVGALANTRLNLVLTFRDHGQIANVLDGIDPVTIEWDALLEFAGAYLGPMMGMMNGFSTGGTMNLGGSGHASSSGTDTASDAPHKDLLRNAAVGQETYYVDHGTYTMDADELGLVIPDEVLHFSIERADANGYCMVAVGPDGDLWSYDPMVGMAEGPCS